MQVALSYDNDGNIKLMFDPSKLKSDKGTLTYHPAAGENHSILAVPAGLEGKSIPDLASLLRVNTTGATHVLEART